MGAQRDNLDRVSQRIATAILRFAQYHLLFNEEELGRFVEANCGKLAPGSADRVLRDLRQRGELDYRVVDREASLYQIIHIATDPFAYAREAVEQQRQAVFELSSADYRVVPLPPALAYAPSLVRPFADCPWLR